MVEQDGWDERGERGERGTDADTAGKDTVDKREVWRRSGVAAARGYVRRGWMVVPLRPHSKQPAQSRWQKTRIAEEALDAAFPPDRNIGLLLGSPSDGLVDVDCDTREAQRAAQVLLPPTGMSFGRSDGIGLPTHYLYQI